MKRTLIAALALVVFALAGCSDSPTRPAKTTPPSPYRDLTQPWHVLNNLEQAYNDMNIARYQEIFDPDNFTFYFGGGVPVAWGYADEIQSATHLFTQQPDKNGQHPVISIDLTLYDIETATWTDVNPPPEFAGETWKQTTMDYTFTIETGGNLTYRNQGTPNATFTVREIDGKWKLVEWQDLANTYLSAAAPAAIEETTWGKLKALYR